MRKMFLPIVLASLTALIIGREIAPQRLSNEDVLIRARSIVLHEAYTADEFKLDGMRGTLQFVSCDSINPFRLYACSGIGAVSFLRNQNPLDSGSSLGQSIISCKMSGTLDAECADRRPGK